MKNAVLALCVATVFVLPSAVAPAHAGFLTKMLLAGAAGTCAANAACHRKMDGAKDAFVRKFGPGLARRCGGSPTCSGMVARYGSGQDGLGGGTGIAPGRTGSLDALLSSR